MLTAAGKISSCLSQRTGGRRAGARAGHFPGMNSKEVAGCLSERKGRGALEHACRAEAAGNKPPQGSHGAHLGVAQNSSVPN